ncbi:BtrH N-terminal domain-containing protein [Paenibacillus sp. SC116]|uniref:BtrH N-terminal domain-containing protein n=1 Tax=Paenibacillus sp. SC116 TaxID=2968986 RepID=UPI00215B16F5|nr:BtrH N-terminal domain-containing protein [Paenibacillus sp. SC116]MCR8844344.1 BtrH N-terminal domain-containing protein [Paenibacillus sp. SC116]
MIDMLEVESALVEKTKKVVILPFEKPKVYGFLGHAYVLGVLQPYEYAQPWIHSSYIQLFFSKHYLNDLGEYRLDFYPDLMIAYRNLPWLEYKHSDKKILKQLGVDIHKYLITQLERESYVVTYVDEYYIGNTSSYQQYHFIHDIFIYGYDLERQIYHVAIFDKNRQFSMQEVSFEQFEQAYSVDSGVHSLINSFKRLEPADYEASKFGAGLARFEFDLQLIIDTLQDYLEGKNSTERLKIQQHPVEGIFGMDIYPLLQEFTTKMIDGIKYFDVRPFHILWEHKMMMIARIKYLQQLGHLSADTPILAEFEWLEKRAYAQRNKVIKGHMCDDRKILQSINDSLQGIQAGEQIAITQLIEELQKNNS